MSICVTGLKSAGLLISILYHVSSFTDNRAFEQIIRLDKYAHHNIAIYCRS